MKHKTKKQKQTYDSWLREANRLIKPEKQEEVRIVKNLLTCYGKMCYIVDCPQCKTRLIKEEKQFRAKKEKARAI